MGRRGRWGGDGGEERGGAEPICPAKLGVAGDREKRHGAEVNGENCANLIVIILVKVLACWRIAALLETAHVL